MKAAANDKTTYIPGLVHAKANSLLIKVLEVRIQHTSFPSAHCIWDIDSIVQQLYPIHSLSTCQAIKSYTHHIKCCQVN